MKVSVEMSVANKNFPKRAARQQGAVLLILLAVLALAGSSLLMGAFGQVKPQVLRAQRTQAVLAEAREALAGFATVNGRLPRPSISATNGSERSAPCTSDADCTGYLPWVTLGVTGIDAWGKRLRYSVTPALTSYDYQPSSAVATRTVQWRDSDGTLRYLAGSAACSVPAPCAAAVVLSHGQRNFGVDASGLALANAANGNDDEEVNATSSLHFIARPIAALASEPGGEFDDQLAWLSLPLLYQRMRAARTLPN